MGKFVIPQKNQCLIAEYENNALSVTGKIDLPYASKSVFLKNGLLVSIYLGEKPKHRGLKIYDEHGKRLYKNAAYKFRAISRKDTTVYLGGQYRKGKSELFSYMDLAAVDFTVNELETPIKSIEGKSIDDILIRGNTLFLVDNILYPKYIFAYDISEPDNPRHAGTEKLPGNGTYEHIYKGDINGNWMILFSSGYGRRGAFQHITVTAAGQPLDRYRKLTFCVKSYDDEENETNAEPRYFIRDIRLTGDRLLILERNALYALDLTQEITLKNLVPLEPNKARYDKLIKITGERCLLVSEESWKLYEA
jgi:hypothetical protein